jgi:protein disulfide-isomerase A1
MDGTTNDIPPNVPFKVSGFPTLKFQPAGTDHFIDYLGDRSLESLIEFIEQSRATSPEGDVFEEEEEGEDDDVPEHDEL